MQANLRSLTGVMGSAKRFRIPQYQRPYCWTLEEAEQLWNDLWEAYEESRDLEAGRSPDDYFLGPIVGELLYAIEYRDEAVELALDGELTVPPNLVILGTMNSVDRSVALVDYALRRRFGFVRVDPDPEVIRSEREGEAWAGQAADALRDFNVWITKRLSREHAIGHSLFLSAAADLTDAKALDRLFEREIAPLLEEYFFGQPEDMAQAHAAWAAAVGGTKS